MEHTVRFRGEDWAILSGALWARGDVESAAVVLAAVLGGPDGVTLAARDIVPVPDEAYRCRLPDRIEISPTWMNMQCRTARLAGYAVLTAHTHLTDGRAGFSWADDEGDARLMPALSAQMPGMPHGSMNLTLTDAAARVLCDGSLREARVVVVGADLRVLPREPAAPESPAHARQELALGRAGQQKLRRLKVGVVGLGGTGSVVTELLVRLGVTSLVLVDGDEVEPSNLSRILGSTPDDVARASPKVAVAERQARSSSSVSVRTRTEALATEGDLSPLLGCDVVFSCVDRLAPRALLNRFAYSANVPVVDMGSAFRVDPEGKLISQGGKVAIIGPGRPCLWCWGDLDSERVRVELLTAEQRTIEEAAGYIAGADAPQPSVITFNSMLAATATTLFLQLVTNYAGARNAPDRLNFDFVTGAVTRALARRRAGCTFCGAPSGVSERDPDD